MHCTTSIGTLFEEPWAKFPPGIVVFQISSPLPLPLLWFTHSFRIDHRLSSLASVRCYVGFAVLVIRLVRGHALRCSS